MADPTQLDPADRTPLEVLVAIGQNTKAYPLDQCLPCGAVIHMGFFFDGFGRHRDHDDPTTSRYSNICRLWEAHRDNDDRRRQKTVSQFWYRFYYSGLGTELNQEAREGLVMSGLSKVGKGAAHAVEKKAVEVGKKVTGVDRLVIKPTSAMTEGVRKGLEEFSYRPVTKAFNDLTNKTASAPANVGRVLKLAADDRWVIRGRAALGAIVYDIKDNPLRAGWSAIKEVFAGVVLDSVPLFRDNRIAALLLGTGVEDRLAAAKLQFESAIADVKLQMPKVRQIYVSIFGADRGCVLARAFANELTKKYQHPSEASLAFVDPKDPNDTIVPIEIKFMGLLDAVSSLTAENKLVSMLPFVNLIKQNYGDRKLAVPASVQRCVHFAAAHELRFYQRLDSLEDTRGVRYLYPGTSEDITGGAPAGTLGARAELQRVVLRDMLNEAVSYGVVLDMMENMAEFKPETFKKFTLATPLSDGETTYKMRELIEAYQELVPRVARLNFVAHMEVFLRWMAVRYQSRAFRSGVASRLDAIEARHRQLLQERNDAQTAYNALRKQWPATDTQALAKAQVRLDTATQAEMAALRETMMEKPRPSIGVWDRIEQESQVMLQRESRQAGLQRSADQVRDQSRAGRLPWGTDPKTSIATIESAMMTPEQETLAQAWKTGLSAKSPLPPKVMALFDLLVHDTMLTSWHDHMLSSPLYFRTRATDKFGATDYIEEDKRRVRDERAAGLATRLGDGMTPAPRAPGGM